MFSPEVTEEIAVTDNKVISDDETPDNEPSAVSAASPSSTYQQGIDDLLESGRKPEEETGYHS